MTKISPFSDAIADVFKERRRQNEKWGGADHDDTHTSLYFIMLIKDYATWAGAMLAMGNRTKMRKRLIQVAALAIAAVESIDRFTPPEKSGS